MTIQHVPRQITVELGYDQPNVFADVLDNRPEEKEEKHVVEIADPLTEPSQIFDELVDPQEPDERREDEQPVGRERVQGRGIHARSS